VVWGEKVSQLAIRQYGISVTLKWKKSGAGKGAKVAHRGQKGKQRVNKMSEQQMWTKYCPTILTQAQFTDIIIKEP
jgi:hypothetical protein